MISSRVRHNKTHPNGHHDVHARQTRDRRGKNRQNFYLQPEWRSSAVPVQPFMSRVGWVSDGTCTKRKMFDLPRTPNGGCVAYDRRQKVPRQKRRFRRRCQARTSVAFTRRRLRLVAPLHSQVAPCPGLPVSPVEQKQRNASLSASRILRLVGKFSGFLRAYPNWLPPTQTIQTQPSSSSRVWTHTHARQVGCHAGTSPERGH